MSFNNRTEFIRASASEKTVLAHIDATSRLYTWTLHSGSVYKRVTNYFVYDLKEDQTQLTEVSSIAAVVAGTFYYDINSSTVYVRTTGSVSPATVQMIVTYRFFFSNSTLDAPHDLIDGSKHVLYQGRINNNPGYKHKVGIEQGLTSLVGTGDLVLENNDGGLDDIFDTLFFENQLCTVYSWNKDLPYDDAKKIYKGRVTNKSYNGQTITFTVKDQIYDLIQTLPQRMYSSLDNVTESIVGNVKRWIYGRVDGLKVQSIDQIGTGYNLTGTLTGTPDSDQFTGIGTLFLSEVSPNDTITIRNIEYTIDSIQSDTLLTVNETPDFAFSNETVNLVPDIPVRNKNRSFYVADHACTKITKILVSVIQFNRIEVNNTTGLNVGDYLEFETGERVAIRGLATGNVIVLQQNLIVIPSISSSIIRQPIQDVYVTGKRVLPENYTISNLGAPDNKVTITLDTDTEFVLARARDLGVQLTFTNSSRAVTTAESVDLRELLSPRDWIRPADITFTTYYEILSVSEQSIELRINFADPTHTGDVQAKLPDYIGDDTVVSVNVLGRTETGEPAGEWITTAAQAVKDMATQVGLTDFNTATFDAAKASSAQLISLALPLSPGSTLTSAKDAIDLINKSVYGSLTLDDNLDMQYRILRNDVPSTPTIIKDSDVVSWRIKSTNGKTFRNTIVKYRYQDYNKVTKLASNSAVDHSSEFVRDYIGTNQTSELSAYLYDTTDAQIMAHRHVYFNRLGRSDITIESDLRLESIEIGDTIQLEFSRLYKRFGDETSRKKLMLVVGLTKNGEEITIEATDLNNTFNSSTVITPNDAPDYADASDDERLKYGYITDNQGIVDDSEDTANINLIS